MAWTQIRGGMERVRCKICRLRGPSIAMLRWGRAILRGARETMSSQVAFLGSGHSLMQA